MADVHSAAAPGVLVQVEPVSKDCFLFLWLGSTMPIPRIFVVGSDFQWTYDWLTAPTSTRDGGPLVLAFQQISQREVEKRAASEAQDKPRHPEV